MSRSSRPSETSPTVVSRYRALLEAGTLDPDPAQAALALRLDALAADLASQPTTRKAGPLEWLLGESREITLSQGLYIWGAVGRGKTMLMDLFFESLPTTGKRRAHFHAYMADVHRRIHAWRQKLKKGEVSGDDPIRPVAASLAAEARVLCFDEFAVTDIADAMILGRLFTALFAEGVVVVATSNLPPCDLYRDGLNRALFMPFIRLLEERTDTVRLDARTDFRLEKFGDAPVYFTPADAAADRAMDELFRRMTGTETAREATLQVLGHPVAIPAQAMGVARFRFEDLCGRALGASDYLAIAQAYHTVFVDQLPQLHADQRNEARRLILLVDVLYERRVKLVVSAAVPADALYRAETGAETFEFARTASRLHEMASRQYLASSRAEKVTGNATGLVDT